MKCKVSCGLRSCLPDIARQMGKFMKGTYVAIGSFKACLAKPEKGSGPGIVLLQEIFGINQYIRDVADYYAEEDLSKYLPA